MLVLTTSTDDPSGQLMKPDAFFDTVRLQKQDTFTRVSRWAQGLIDDLDELKQNLTVNGEDAYMIEAMRPVYAKVRKIKRQPLPSRATNEHIGC